MLPFSLNPERNFARHSPEFSTVTDFLENIVIILTILFYRFSKNNDGEKYLI